MIYLSDVIHTPGPDAFHPVWDTLIALRNKDTVPVTARITLWNENDGSQVQWPDLNGGAPHPYSDVILRPGLSWAASFLPGNGFTAGEGASTGPAQNFRGHGAIDCFNETPFGPRDETANVLAFVLLANNWKYGVNAPVFRTGVQAATQQQSLWQFAYSIPHFDDTQGATATVWQTGVSIQNFSVQRVNITLSYTIEQTYPEAGQVYTMMFAIPAQGGVRFDLLQGNPAQNVPGLLSVGYPPTLNSEGHVDLVADQPTLLQPSLIIASQDYSFMVGEDFKY